MQALDSHRDAIILVGAQALYIHTGEGDLGLTNDATSTADGTPFTTDADLGIDPMALAGHPLLEEVLDRAKFYRAISTDVGRFFKDRLVNGKMVPIPLDLLVPEALGGNGTRGARLGPHGYRAARKARGLEPALVDKAPHTIASLEQDDARTFRINVAGRAAILVAKLHKVNERASDAKRRDTVAKDSLDVLRLLRHSDLGSLATTINDLAAEPATDDAVLAEAIAGVTKEALQYLDALFTREGKPGCQLAAEAATGIEDPAIVTASLAALATDLQSLVRDS